MAGATVATIEQQTQDTAYRIGRLARYCDRPIDNPPTVIKHHGVFHLISVTGRILACEPRTFRVWHWWDRTLLSPIQALESLMAFEAALTRIALERARHEAIEELARRKINRVTRPKTRGFKADMKKRKPSRAKSE